MEQDENIPQPKVEKVSLKELKNEVKKQQDEELQKKVDAFVDAFVALTPEERKHFLNLK